MSALNSKLEWKPFSSGTVNAGDDGTPIPFPTTFNEILLEVAWTTYMQYHHILRLDSIQCQSSYRYTGITGNHSNTNITVKYRKQDIVIHTLTYDGASQSKALYQLYYR